MADTIQEYCFAIPSPCQSDPRKNSFSNPYPVILTLEQKSQDTYARYLASFKIVAEAAVYLSPLSCGQCAVL